MVSPFSMARFGLLLALGLASLAPAALAQPEIVPAEHPVYDFLLDQRVAGALPEYRHEALPLGRARITAHLDSLEARGVRVSGWLRDFGQELREPLGRVGAWVGDGAAAPWDPRAERFLGYQRDSTWRAAIRAGAALQGRAARGATTRAGDAISPGGGALVPELVIEGNWRRRVGFYTGTSNGLQVTGDTRVLLADPVLAPLYYVQLDSSNVPGSFDRTTASLRAVAGPLSAELANSRLRIGPSADRPLLLADGADYLPHVRLGLDTRAVRYTFVHASLTDRSVFTRTPDGDAFLSSPERYLALHRVEAQPLRWASVGFTEMVVYGFRGPELAYLNPLFPIKPAEHALWDRDNSLFALDATVRPLRGVEAYGTWLVDDLDFSNIGEASVGNKWAVQGGVQAAVLAGVTAFGEYTRIEPFTYTHRFSRDGVFYNAYAQNGFALGHPLGPNADQVLAGVRAWLPGRIRARVAGRYVRRGENPRDPDTGELVNVGGDLRNGRLPDVWPRKEFLGGDRIEGPGVQLDLSWEPANDLALRLFADVQAWDADRDRAFVRAEAKVRL